MMIPIIFAGGQLLIAKPMVLESRKLVLAAIDKNKKDSTGFPAHVLMQQSS